MIAGAALAGTASAQTGYGGYLDSDSAIIRPTLPEGFDRGRNESVLEHPNPDYAPLGIPVSSFFAYPRIEIGAGGTSNTFLTSSSRAKASGFALIDPSLRVISDWSRHKLEVDASADLERYISNSLRNQDNWNVGALGDLEVGSAFTLSGEADVARQFDSPYSGSTLSTLAVLSNYLTSFVSARGTYAAGRVRAMVAGDRTTLDYSRLNTGSGAEQTQSDRNREVTRASGQLEYAFTPSVSLYGQGVYTWTSYDRLLSNGTPNRDSHSVRVSGGANFDVAGFMRGTIAVGYVHRNFDSALYKSISGPSAEALVEFFPTYLTTVSLRLRRFLEDSSIGSNLPYFDNRVSLHVDHALLQNLILQATAEYAKIHYPGQDQDRDTYRVMAGAQYASSRRFGLRGNVSYGTQSVQNTNFGVPFTEVRGVLSVYVQR